MGRVAACRGGVKSTCWCGDRPAGAFRSAPARRWTILALAGLSLQGGKLEPNDAGSQAPWLMRHRLGAFFFLTFLISWGIWIPVQLFLAQHGKIHPLTFVGAYGPFLAAMLVLYAGGKGTGMRDWLRRTFRFRVGATWYLVGFLLPVFIGLVQYGLYLMLGGKPGPSRPSWFLYLINVPITALFAGGNEEPGWRGFALPAMLERQQPVVASVLLGVVWTIWHLPLYFSSGWSGASHSLAWVLLSVIGLSIIMTWLYLRSKGSVIPAMLLHQGTNHIGNYFRQTTDVLPGVDDWQILRGAVYWIVAVAVLVWTKGRLGGSRPAAGA